MKDLFKSEAAYRLLEHLTASPGKEFYLAELAKVTGKDTANVTRELAKLQREGIVSVSVKGGKKYYAVNPDYSALPELKALLAKVGTSAIDEKFNTTWLLGEDIPNMAPDFSKIWLNGFVDEFVEPGGRAYQKIAAIYRDYHLWFYYDKDDACAVGEHLVDRFEADPAFMDEVNQQIVRHSDMLRAFAETIPEENLSQLTNEQLWKIYQEHEDIHTAYYQWGWIPPAADMFCENLTERGKKILRFYDIPEDSINEYLTKLTQPQERSLIKREQDALSRLALQVHENPQQRQLFQDLFRKFKEEDVKEFGLYTHSPEYERQFEQRVRDLVGTIDPQILEALQQHYTKYFYTKFLFTEEQGTYSFEHFLKELVRRVNQGEELKRELQAEEEEFQHTLREREKSMAQLKLSAAHIQFFNAWGQFMITKIYRRYAQLFAIYKMTVIVEEIGRRLGLTLKETRFATTPEVERGLRGEVIDTDHIKRRVVFSVRYATKHEDTIYLAGEAERALTYLQKEDIQHVTELKGQCGCPGNARGTVKIVNVTADMNKMQPGDILVSISTQPDLLPAMKKAAAFVTEQGGVTSHAAIVARELKTPCVIGTKIATKVLKDGMQVEVDATKGVVRILES